MTIYFLKQNFLTNNISFLTFEVFNDLYQLKKELWKIIFWPSKKPKMVESLPNMVTLEESHIEMYDIDSFKSNFAITCLWIRHGKNRQNSFCDFLTIKIWFFDNKIVRNSYGFLAKICLIFGDILYRFGSFRQLRVM